MAASVRHIVFVCLLFSAVLADSLPESQKPEEVAVPLDNDVKVEEDHETLVDADEKLEQSPETLIKTDVKLEEQPETLVKTDVKIPEEDEEPEGSPTTKVVAQFMGNEERVISVDFGEKVAVQCSADGDPVPFFRWYRRLSDIHSTWENVGSNPFETLEVFHNAVYICIARNINNGLDDSVSSQELVINLKNPDHDNYMFHRDFDHSEESFRQSMMFRKPDYIHVTYMNSTIIVGVVLSITIVVLLTIIVVSQCRRSKSPYLPVYRSHVTAVSGDAEKHSHHGENFGYSHLVES